MTKCCKTARTEWRALPYVTACTAVKQIASVASGGGQRTARPTLLCRDQIGF